MANSASLTGYGPRISHRPIAFDGDERRYELWETKFLGYMKIRGLSTVFKTLEDSTIEINTEQDEEAYAELVQFLDDRSLSLIIRDGKDSGRRALNILQNHYLPKGKARVITLYNELTSLVNHQCECMTDYVIRAETAANSLKQAGENISDSLLVAMVLKGLPKSYQPFITVTTQREKQLTFSEFKESLRNQEDTVHSSESSVMNVASSHRYIQNHKRQPFVTHDNDTRPSQHQSSRWCSECKSRSHDTQFCRNRNGKKWCQHCKSSTHQTTHCRKLNKSSAKGITSDTNVDDNTSFTFFVGHDSDTISFVTSTNSILV